MLSFPAYQNCIIQQACYTYTHTHTAMRLQLLPNWPHHLVLPRYNRSTIQQAGNRPNQISVTLKKDFSTPALLTFGPDNSVLGQGRGAVGIFTLHNVFSILQPLDASHTPPPPPTTVKQPKMCLNITKCPLEDKNCSLVESHCISKKF